MAMIMFPDNERRMLDLINTFPSIKKCGGPPEWNSCYFRNPKGLQAYYEQVPCDAQLVIEFALAVWNDKTHWDDFGFRSFSLRRAAARWDHDHWKAFFRWVKDPVMP